MRSSQLPPHIYVRPLSLADLDEVVRLESTVFSEEERATKEKVSVVDCLA